MRSKYLKYLDKHQISAPLETIDRDTLYAVAALLHVPCHSTGHPQREWSCFKCGARFCRECAYVTYHYHMPIYNCPVCKTNPEEEDWG